MFGLFKKVTVDHAKLGLLTRRGRGWEGNIEIKPGQNVPLELEGTKAEPHELALAAAIELPGKLPELLPAIAAALFDHLEPYRDALDDPDAGFAEQFDDPKVIQEIKSISTHDDALTASDILGVEISLAGDKARTLIKFGTLWDEEHTVGAYFDDWKFMELNGSV